MDKNEMQKKIFSEEDYIRCPKCSNSLQKFLSKNNDGVENSAIARLLMMSEEEVSRLYEEAIEMLQEQVKDEE